jgi:DNA recombination protein RmuC
MFASNNVVESPMDVVILVLVVLILIMLVLLWRRPVTSTDPTLATTLLALDQQLQRVEQRLLDQHERLATRLTEQLERGKQQQSQHDQQFANDALTRSNELRQTLDEKLRHLQADAKLGREEMATNLMRFGSTQSEQLQQLTTQLNERLQQLMVQNEQKADNLRTQVEARLKDLQSDNAQKLEKMRETVDEKLHATLEQRLGESFKLVSERLELVHQGLGDMKNLASGVGDLKKVLTNVRTRGTFGEVQLAALLEQIMASGQYEANVATVPGSNERVEFAIKLPGNNEDEHIWLPIDAKFPIEDYQRLIDAQERADLKAAEQAASELETRIRFEAKKIRDKYISPPHTTDFAILFLPTESLYAEVLRRPGLQESLNRDLRIQICGPTTLFATLNSLQMGFRTLAIQKRSGEVWKVLGAVKTEFGKFGETLAATRKKLDEASNNIGKIEVRSRAMGRQLKEVEALPQAQSQALLGISDDGNDDTTE